MACFRFLLFLSCLLFCAVKGKERCVYISGKTVTCHKVGKYILRDYSQVSRMNLISFVDMNITNTDKFCLFLPRNLRYLYLDKLYNQKEICTQIKNNPGCHAKIDILKGCDDTVIKVNKQNL